MNKINNFYLQSKLTSYRDLQKAGKELNSDQKVAVAKYDEVAQTLEFARDLSKQVTIIATAAEREAKKQAKKVLIIVRSKNLVCVIIFVYVHYKMFI